jgi:hypothetical protein
MVMAQKRFPLGEEEHSACHFSTRNVVCMDYCIYALSVLLG